MGAPLGIPLERAEGSRDHDFQTHQEKARAVTNTAPEPAPLMILVAGPYRSGTNDDPSLVAANVRAMTDTALRLFRAGHLPVLGEWFAPPLIERAGSKTIGDATFNEIFHPLFPALGAQCGACLPVGGPSPNADHMAAAAQSPRH